MLDGASILSCDAFFDLPLFGLTRFCLFVAEFPFVGKGRIVGMGAGARGGGKNKATHFCLKFKTWDRRDHRIATCRHHGANKVK